VGVRWKAEDPNDDALEYTVEIQPVGETTWLPLKEHWKQAQISWDSTAYGDGEYRLRVTVSDRLSNTPESSLATSEVSEPFLIDNNAPALKEFRAEGSAGKSRLQWTAEDAHSALTKAQYSLNGGEWTLVEPEGGISDSRVLRYSLELDEVRSGENVISIRVTDEFDNQAVITRSFDAGS
jgi:hypothetical protein